MRTSYLLLAFSLLSNILFAQEINEQWVKDNYTKREVMIPMRDGIRLFTAIYEPVQTDVPTPIFITRTTYTAGPYGEGYNSFLWNKYRNLVKAKYVIVIQDVRGRWRSEGDFVNVRPFKAHKKGKKDIDEASDTYDTAEWLIKNVKSNGKIGVGGTSYPGFYTVMAALSGHPAIKAVVPQAPVTDWWMGDDYHHHGAFMLTDMFNFSPTYMDRPRPVPTDRFISMKPFYLDDEYSFFMRHKTMKDLTRLAGDSILFWKDLMDHPDYDDWWKARDSRRSLYRVKPAVLVVGGFFDAEDCYGTLGVYKSLRRQSPETDLNFIMGPWFHGAWERDLGNHLGDILFGANTSKYYLDEIEFPFLQYYLNGIGEKPSSDKAVHIFFTGKNEWKDYPVWPVPSAQDYRIYLEKDGGLSTNVPSQHNSYSEYVSDPNHPVPYVSTFAHGRSASYMTADQRFASTRPDVLTFRTDILESDLTLAGEIHVDLNVSISTTDADFIIKVIDEFPEDFRYDEKTYVEDNQLMLRTRGTMMGSYQMLVRGETMRGRYRNSFEHPEAFQPNEITKVSFDIPDIAHCFKKGHRLMIQIQSTWFPLTNINPQQFVNINTCDEKDFVKSDIRIYHDASHPSSITFQRLAEE